MPDIKFSYPEIKHVLYKIGRHSSCVFGILDLKYASINLTEESKQYTSFCASPGSPTYQNNKLSQGLNGSPAYFTSLMNDVLHELPAYIREYIDCIMDDVIIFIPDIKTQKGTQNLHAYVGMLLSINKIHTFQSKGEIYGFVTIQEGQPTNHYTFWITCEGYFQTTYTYNSQRYQIMYWLCYLSSTISTKAIRANQANQ